MFIREVIISYRWALVGPYLLISSLLGYLAAYWFLLPGDWWSGDDGTGLTRFRPVIGIILALKSPWNSTPYPERRVCLSFIIIFLTTQLFIFGYTEMGIWADHYTAINRLPLQFIPALLFAAIVIFHSRLVQKTNSICHA